MAKASGIRTEIIRSSKYPWLIKVLVGGKVGKIAVEGESREIHTGLHEPGDIGYTFMNDMITVRRVDRKRDLAYVANRKAIEAAVQAVNALADKKAKRNPVKKKPTYASVARHSAAWHSDWTDSEARYFKSFERKHGSFGNYVDGYGEVLKSKVTGSPARKNPARKKKAQKKSFLVSRSKLKIDAHHGGVVLIVRLTPRASRTTAQAVMDFVPDTLWARSEDSIGWEFIMTNGNPSLNAFVALAKIFNKKFKGRGASAAVGIEFEQGEGEDGAGYEIDLEALY